MQAVAPPRPQSGRTCPNTSGQRIEELRLGGTQYEPGRGSIRHPSAGAESVTADRRTGIRRRRKNGCGLVGVLTNQSAQRRHTSSVCEPVLEVVETLMPSRQAVPISV